MKFLFLLMIVAVALAIEKEVVSVHEMAEGFSRIFNISLADGAECIQKSGITTEDMIYMEDTMAMSESEITDMQSVRKASCAMVCASQKQGTMIGKNVDLDKVFEYFDKYGLPKDIADKLRDIVRVCKDQVQNDDDECMAGYQFLKCMYQRSRHVLNKD